MTAATAPSRLARWWGSDLAYNFRHSPVAVVSAVVLVICLGAAFFAPWVAPHNPFDLATLNLMDALTPPHGVAGARPEYLLGTDDQGRDLLSAIMFGARISLLVGLASVIFAMLLGVTLGLIAGYVGGKLDAVIMRVADAAFARNADSRRQRFSFCRRVVDHGLPGRGAGHHGAGDQSAGRLAARRAQSEAAIVAGAGHCGPQARRRAQMRLPRARSFHPTTA